MNIRCRKIDCEFNQNGTCHAANVAVSKNANCATYQKNNQKKDAELAAELTPTIPNNVPLRCRAQGCLYHHRGRCAANGIAVIAADHQDKADCATFIER